MTKRILISAMAVFAITFMAKAQDSFQVGLKAGLTSTQYTTEDVKFAVPEEPDFNSVTNDAKGGYLLGAYARLKLFGNISFQPELYYAQKSGDVTYSTSDGNLNQEVKMHTWDIPLLAHIKILDLKVTNIYVLTGPVLSFNAKDASDFPDLTSDVKDDVNKAVWAYQLGAGVEAWRLNFDVRYEWGLSNVSDGISDIEFSRKSDMLTLAVSYRLFGL